MRVYQRVVCLFVGGSAGTRVRVRSRDAQSGLFISVLLCIE